MADIALVNLNINIDHPAIQAEIRRCVEAEREACARALCVWCEGGLGVDRSVRSTANEPIWYHREWPHPTLYSCAASAIRERHHQQTESTNELAK